MYTLFVRQEKEPLIEKRSEVVLGLDEPNEHDDEYVHDEHDRAEVCFLARHRGKVAIHEHVLDEHELALRGHDIA